MKDFVKVMKALSDPNRVKLLKMLQYKTMCVCELQSARSDTAGKSEALAARRARNCTYQRKPSRYTTGGNLQKVISCSSNSNRRGDEYGGKRHYADQR